MGNVPLTDAWTDRFVHRKDYYARQWYNPAVFNAQGEMVKKESKGYTFVPEPLTEEVVRKHLAGEHTIAVFPVASDNTVTYGVLDYDVTSGREKAKSAQQVLRMIGVDAAIEQSRDGRAHLWVFAQEPIPAIDMRAILFFGGRLTEMTAGQIKESGIEVIPKQERLYEGARGASIRGPFGIHRRTNERYPFIDGQSKGVASTLRGQIEYISAMPRSDIARILERAPHIKSDYEAWKVRAEQERANRFSNGGRHRTFVRTAFDNTKNPYKEFAQAVDIVDVISSYVPIKAGQMVRCPLPDHATVHAHNDATPSFMVLSRANRFQCKATDEHGDAIDFICRMEGMTPKQALEFAREKWGSRLGIGNGNERTWDDR